MLIIQHLVLSSHAMHGCIDNITVLDKLFDFNAILFNILVQLLLCRSSLLICWIACFWRINTFIMYQYGVVIIGVVNVITAKITSVFWLLNITFSLNSMTF